MNGTPSETSPAAPGAPAPDIETPEEEIEVPDVLPALTSGAAVLFPGLMVPLVSQDQSIIGAIDEAAASPNKMVAIFAQKPGEDGQPTDETYSVGTAAVIARMAKAPTGAVQAIIQGVSRVTLRELQQKEPWLRVRVERLPDVSKADIEIEALTRTANSLFDSAVRLAENVPQELALAAAGLQDPGHQHQDRGAPISPGGGRHRGAAAPRHRLPQP
jgi:ATP-dependent Lon protease